MAKQTKLLAFVLLLTFLSGSLLPNIIHHSGSTMAGKTAAVGVMESASGSLSIDSDDKKHSFSLEIEKALPELILLTVILIQALTIFISCRLHFSMPVFYQSNYVIKTP